MSISSYRDLIVWQKAVELVIAMYDLSEKFPSVERFGLTNQMRRAAISIPSNIAEGSRRTSSKDFRHFLVNSFGSGSELETQVIIAKRLYARRNLDFLKVDSLLDEVMRILNKMINNLKNSDK